MAEADPLLELGRALWAERIKSLAQLRQSLAQQVADLDASMREAMPFERAIYLAERGDQQQLVDLIHPAGGYELTTADRQALANYVAGRRVIPLPSAGAPRSNERHAAGIALDLYSEWQEHARRLKIATRGRAIEMKDEAAQLVCDWLPGGADYEKVRKNMTREKQRQ